MIQAWYEKKRDEKDHIYFARHVDMHRLDWRGANPFPGFHGSVEFAFGLSGQTRIMIDGREHFLRAGEVCFINSFELHRYYYTEPSECYIVLISSGFFNDVNRLGTVSFPPHTGKTEQFDTVKRYLDYTMENWDPDSLVCKRAFADTLAYLMSRFYPSFPKQTRKDKNEAMLRAIKYICEHCEQRLTMESIARMFGYSTNHFSTTFNRFMGASFTDYLNSCRIVEYHRIRRGMPEIPTYKAAQMCGFASMNTFYRALNKFESDRENGYAASRGNAENRK